eukprot:12882024-Prorocentrum_lima.AAC.1
MDDLAIYIEANTAKKAVNNTKEVIKKVKEVAQQESMKLNMGKSSIVASLKGKGTLQQQLQAVEENEEEDAGTIEGLKLHRCCKWLGVRFNKEGTLGQELK